ncbi:hypothetical protein [Fodinibius sp. SL11]|uniref:hypothetical protein n=1 Tax=Fodinibius sp. SL11 TaxID=3425690 RepID=UPI003F884C9B
MKCPVCRRDAKVQKKDMGRYLEVDCLKCGSFEWEKDIRRYIDSLNEHSILLSYWIRNNQNRKEELHLDDKLVKAIIEDTELPSPQGKAEKLLLLVGHDLTKPHKQLVLTPGKKLEYIAKIGASGENELSYIVNYLKSKNLVDSIIDFKPGAENKFNKGSISITFQGWSKYEDLRKELTDSTAAFMAMEFGDTNIEKAYEECFKGAVAKTGFKLFNLQDIPKAGLIDNRLRAEIRNARFLLADLTNDNLGAYWEAGFAEGLSKPVIYLCEKTHFENFQTHFDTNHHYTVIYEMDKLDDAAEELKATIRATLPSEAKMQDS